MAEHWVEIATVDYGVKLSVSLVLFVPLYGVLLNGILRAITRAAKAPPELHLGRGASSAREARRGRRMGRATFRERSETHQ